LWGTQAPLRLLWGQGVPRDPLFPILGWAGVGHNGSPPMQPPPRIEEQITQVPSPQELEEEKTLQDELSLPILFVDQFVANVAKNLNRVMADMAKPIGI